MERCENDVCGLDKYKKVVQLHDKDKFGEEYPIFPVTYTHAVYDKNGASLESMLAQFNNVFLQYQGTAKDTRLLLPKDMRRKGIQITYRNMDDEVVTEKCVNDSQSDNDHWGLDANWMRIDELSLQGDISVSKSGTWVINGADTGVKALGPKGDNGLTPWMKTIDNKLYYSYDNKTWELASDYIAAWFRFTGTAGSSQAGNIGKIQISRDEGNTWADLSGEFTNSLHIKGYVATTSDLPSSAVQGDIYGVGPTYAESDTDYINPIYRLYVKDGNGWVDNGQFTGIAAGIVQELGDSETEVMSQKTVTYTLIPAIDSLKSSLSLSEKAVPSYTVTDGFQINSVTGDLVVNSTNSVTSFIPLEKGDFVIVRSMGISAELAQSYVAVIAVYDEDENYLKTFRAGGTNVQYYIALAPCKIRVCAYTTRFVDAQLIQVLNSDTISKLIIGSYLNIILNAGGVISDKNNLSVQSPEITITKEDFDCLNVDYSIVDKNNLSLEDFRSIYKDSSYSAFKMFSDTMTITAADNMFVGFPTSIVYKGKLYCFYYKSLNHSSTPGRHDNIFYKVSSDKGKTWSTEKEWILPSSDTSGLYRSYRTAYVTTFNENLLFGLFVTTTDSSNQLGSFTLLCEVTVDSQDEISILNNIKVPVVLDGVTTYNFVDSDITNSMIIGGNIAKIGTDYLIGCYTSENDLYLFKFNGDFSSSENVTILDTLLHGEFSYSEHAFVVFDDATVYLLVREDTKREDTPIFEYDISTKKFVKIGSVEDCAFDGLDSVKVDSNTCAIFGRDSRNYYTPCRYVLMNKAGKCYITNAKFYGDVLSRDCAYCTLQVTENDLVNIFYLKTSSTAYNYSVVMNSIAKDILNNLIYY